MTSRGLGDPIEHALIGAFLGALSAAGIWFWWLLNTGAVTLLGLLCCVAIGALICAVPGYFFGEAFFGRLKGIVDIILRFW